MLYFIYLNTLCFTFCYVFMNILLILQMYTMKSHFCTVSDADNQKTKATVWSNLATAGGAWR